MKDKDLIKIIIGIILFISTFVINIEPFRLGVYFITYILMGYKVIFKAIKKIIKGEVFDENFLMSIATIGAIIIGKYEEAVAVMLLYSIGEYLEDKAVDNSKKSIKDLMNLKVEYANLRKDEDIIKVSPKDVKIGDIIIVKPGEKVPCDGIIVKGTSFVDTSSLTGESTLRKLSINDEILSGMIISDSNIEIKVTKEYEDSTVSKIIKLIEEASNNKAKSEEFITKFSKVYTPVVVLIALVLIIVLPLFGYTFYDAVYKALVCLVISCPCALVISVPLSYFASIGSASKEGILIKSSNYLDMLNHINSVTFDKTGTLTKGTFNVTKIVSLNNYKEDELLKYAAYGEYYSNHPIAKSILNKYDKKINEKLISNYKEISGKGISVIVDNKKILLGNDKISDKIEKISEIGTIIYIVIDNKYEGYILISDEIKDSSKKVINYLNYLNIKTIMLTGDNENIAKDVASKLKIKEYHSNLLPTDKVEMMQNIIKESPKNKYNIFVGDGINDAPVLVTSDIGIAMGTLGSDAAIEASDIVFMADDLLKIDDAFKIAKKNKKIVTENIIFALVIKILALILGTLGLISIWIAVIADVGVTIVAILNSLRCLKL